MRWSTDTPTNRCRPTAPTLPHEPGHFSYALPNLDVTSVVVSPIPEPDQLPGSPVTVFRLNYRDLPSDDELLDLADRSPSAHSERHYLRVSTSSWDGQLVASVYVNLALQGHYLRVIMRPFVLAPLVFDLKVADDIAGWNPLILLFLAVSVTVRRFRNVAAKLSRGRAGTDKTERGPAGQIRRAQHPGDATPGPTSTTSISRRTPSAPSG